MIPSAGPCAPCRAQTKQALNSRPHEGLRMVRERTFPGSLLGTVRETDYNCGHCGRTIIHSTNISECAWRYAVA